MALCLGPGGHGPLDPLLGLFSLLVIWPGVIYYEDTSLRFNLEQLFIKYLNLSTSLLLDTQTTCANDAGTHIYIYHENARLIYQSTAAVAGAVLKSK